MSADDKMTDEEFLLERRSRRGGGGHQMVGEDITALNLTPLMDIMTILLVFLIQSLAVEPSNINVTLEMHPPESSTKVDMESATRIIISKADIVVDDEQVVLMSDVKPDKDGVILPVRDALIAAAEKMKALETHGGTKFEGKVLLVADEHTTYDVISNVLVSAGRAQYAQYKLVVMKKGGGG